MSDVKDDIESTGGGDAGDGGHGGTWLLTWLILAGLLIGCGVGEALFRAYDGQVPAGITGGFEFVGNTFFMSLLKMVLVPLVASSVIVGVSSIGDPSQLGKVGGCTLAYYFTTMAMAVILGVALVSMIQPGDPHRDGAGIGKEIINKGEEAYASESQDTRKHIEKTGEGGLVGAFKNIAQQLIPSNPIGSAAEGQLLPVISFSLLLGVVLTAIGDAGKPLLRVFESLFTAIMKLVDWILWLAPIGVLALVAWTVARIGINSLFGPMLLYVITVLAGLAIHAFIVLPLILWLFVRSNPYVFMHQMRAALMTALGTDSSSATLPVTIESAETEGGCSKRAANFVLPLGATINMDGTALYEAVAVVFLFQCYGIELTGVQLAIIVITATLAAIGAAGIPSAGLVTMVIVVQAVNGSLGADAPHLPLAAVGIILGIDRILDMCRTTVNVWGDAVGAKIITRIAPDEITDQAAGGPLSAMTSPE
ncbi:MAG: cation:dicarboxylase symporter family transporter [Phycisphaera sp.]|nr:cation:dicarboxylase symporter family transporter [Phycisphaera sp.]